MGLGRLGHGRRRTLARAQGAGDGVDIVCSHLSLVVRCGNAPRRHMSVGLGCHIAYKPRLIYLDGIDVSNPDQAVPIGVSCRICRRLDCGQRAIRHPITASSSTTAKGPRILI